MTLTSKSSFAVAALAMALAPALQAQTTAPPAAGAAPANEQVVVPQVERRDVRLPKFPSRDWEVGALVGTYATQNFGSSIVAGVRLGYHITEDVFVEAALAQTSVSDESFRQILPGGVFADEKESLGYFSLSAGYNVLPGEVFLGRNRAYPSQIFLVGGVGSTRFANQRSQTFNFGLGTRVYLSDRVSLRVDMRNHVYPLDLLGRRQNTQNLELTAGVGFTF
ncbi:MAG: outer membrane beta-barrel domain-containing protein [Ideonella sp.]|jgi:outer membrane beta-barrel protein|nr:outer membrane beta-barrel domain-containing protein [Ideonella sp.]